MPTFFCTVNLLQVEEELKKRWSPTYKWGEKQVDIWDSQTNFVFSFNQFNDVKDEIHSRFGSHSKFEDLRDYALSRWYSYIANRAIVSIFVSHPLVRQLKDDVDFFIDGLSFELQVLVFPKNYGLSFEETSQDKKEFLEWWIKQTEANINGNTLCMVLHSISSDTWKLKAELSWLQQYIYSYLEKFRRQDLVAIKQKGGLIQTDVLFCEK